MSCTNFPGSIEPPNHGNTYEITIQEDDQLIITVETRRHRIMPKTIITPIGITNQTTDRGEVSYKVDWSIRQAEKEYHE